MAISNLPSAILPRLALILVFTILTLDILTACATRPIIQLPAVTVVATATSAEPRPALPDSLRSDLIALAKSSKQVGNTTVRLVASVTSPITETDLTPHRPNGDVQHAAGDANRQINTTVDAFAHKVSDATADQSGLALLPLLDKASEVPNAHIHVITSGVSTTDPVSLFSLGWDFIPDKVIASVERQGQLPNLAGHRVTFHGLGVTSGSQPSLPPFARDKIETLWVGICERAKAISCGVAHESTATEPPRAVLPVPVVPIPAAVTEGDGCPVYTNLPDDSLTFAANSSVLGTDADSVLRPIVDALRRCSLVVDITGNVADTGSGDPQDLSGLRARAVADRFLALGLSPSQLGTVVGRGATSPVIPNFTNGQFDEAKAKFNRRTELIFHHVTAR